MNRDQALVDSMRKIMGGRNDGTLVCMAILYAMEAPSWQVFGVGVIAITLKFLLDAIEVIRTGRNLPDDGNGNGHGGTTDGTDTAGTAGVMGVAGSDLSPTTPQG